MPQCQSISTLTPIVEPIRDRCPSPDPGDDFQLAAAVSGPPPRDWVAAGPFRAQLRLLLGTGIPEPVLAQLTGISEPALRHLRLGRAGRPVQRVHRLVGMRLLRVSAADIRSLRFLRVGSEEPRQQLQELVADAGPIARLAELAGASVADLEELLDQTADKFNRRGWCPPPTCSKLLALKLAAAYHAWQLGRWPSRQEAA